MLRLLLLVTVAMSFAVARPARAEGAWLPGLVIVPDRACARDLACMARMYADVLTTGSCQAQELRLDNLVTFEPGSARVYSPDRERIAELARQWREHGASREIVVEGFSDARGRAEADNVALSERRAARVRGYLVRYGVDPAYVRTVARGSEGNGRRVGLSIAACDN